MIMSGGYDHGGICFLLYLFVFPGCLQCICAIFIVRKTNNMFRERYTFNDREIE